MRIVLTVNEMEVISQKWQCTQSQSLQLNIITGYYIKWKRTKEREREKAQARFYYCIDSIVFEHNNSNNNDDNNEIGKLTVIVGKSGSGKTSLLAAILKEMRLVSGVLIWNK